MTTTPAPHEQRRSLRVAFGGQALIRAEGHVAFMPCQPQNVSVGGVCLRLNEDMELRSEVDIQLVAPELSHPIQCHGRVNWTTARLDVRPQPPVPYDIGIEFVGISPALRAELDRMIDRLRQHAAPAAA